MMKLFGVFLTLSLTHSAFAAPLIDSVGIDLRTPDGTSSHITFELYLYDVSERVSDGVSDGVGDGVSERVSEGVRESPEYQAEVFCLTHSLQEEHCALLKTRAVEKYREYVMSEGVSERVSEGVVIGTVPVVLVVPDGVSERVSERVAFILLDNPDATVQGNYI
jgi:hypothetical protein